MLSCAMADRQQTEFRKVREDEQFSTVVHVQRKRTKDDWVAKMGRAAAGSDPGPEAEVGAAFSMCFACSVIHACAGSSALASPGWHGCFHVSQDVF